MARGYVYKKPVKRSHYSNFRRRLMLAVFMLAVIAGGAFYVYSNLHSPQQGSPVSAVQNIEVTGNKTTYTNDYFEFQDSPTWVIDKAQTTSKKIIYHKFRKSILEAEMIVYINYVPIPLYLDVPRVLPLRIVNDNSFLPTSVSQPCGSTYAKDELHKVKEMELNGTTMLCDPDSPQYYVILGEVNGDYRLNLKASKGTPIQFVITYKDLGRDAAPDTLMNVASSFKTR